MESNSESMPPSPDDTHVLLRAWQDDGNRVALGQILERNLEFVYRVVRDRIGSQLRDDLQSSDLVQEVALDVLEYGPRFVVSNRNQLRAILVRMIENNIRDRIRWRHSVKRDADRNRQMASSIDLTASTARPEAELEEGELRQLVRLAVGHLGEEDRRIIHLHQLEERPLSEVAERLGLKPQAAHMRYQRALPKLAQKVRLLLRGDLPVDSLNGYSSED